MVRLRLLAAFVVLILGSLVGGTYLALGDCAEEVEAAALLLRGPLADERSEISGLAWHGDTLVLLPQYPGRFPRGGADGSLFTLTRAQLRRATRRPEQELLPTSLAFHAPGLTEVPGYQGLEAVAFAGDEVFVTVELDDEGAMSGLLVKGRVAGGVRDAGVHLDVAGAVPLAPQTGIRNLAYEALTVRRDEVVVFYEANGAANATPRALRFDRSLRPLGESPVDAIEYRVTDATEVDERGRFWASNYFYPETEWRVGACALRARFGDGETHQARRAVERLIELEHTADGVRLTGRAPVQLRLAGVARNWEGLVRFEGGFLAATDKHPQSILAYVPGPR